MSNWLSEDARTFLSRGYLDEGETAEVRLESIAIYAERRLREMGWRYDGYAEKLYSYLISGYISLSSPVWANFGKPHKGLPISCNGSYIDDSVDGIYSTLREVALMTKGGAGTSAYAGAIRGRGSSFSGGGVSDGVMSWLQLYNQTVDTVSQGAVRRGGMAVYLPVTHPDIYEFLKIRSAGNSIQNLHFGVCIPDDWMRSMLDGDQSKRDLWAKIMSSRFSTGEPYIFFTDNVNRNKPQVYKDLDMTIHASNLCTEIALPSDPENSFVCNLASMNAKYYEQWAYTDAVEVLTILLDVIMQDYIELTQCKAGFERAHSFAKAHRALGIGVLGFHTMLQDRNLSFDSLPTRMLNGELFRTIRDKSKRASAHLASKLGEPSLLKGYGLRNATTTAVAPTRSTSLIMGVSQGIEPILSNIYEEDSAKGKFLYKNPAAVRILESHKANTDSVWDSIIEHSGSVQHLGFLSDNERAVLRTFAEIKPDTVISLAAHRQAYIDQAQSINLIGHYSESRAMSKAHIQAWELGVKSLYYLKGLESDAHVLARNSQPDCVACEA